MTMSTMYGSGGSGGTTLYSPYRVRKKSHTLLASPLGSPVAVPRSPAGLGGVVTVRKEALEQLMSELERLQHQSVLLQGQVNRLEEEVEQHQGKKHDNIGSVIKAFLKMDHKRVKDCEKNDGYRAEPVCAGQQQNLQGSGRDIVVGETCLGGNTSAICDSGEADTRVSNGCCEEMGRNCMEQGKTGRDGHCGMCGRYDACVLKHHQHICCREGVQQGTNGYDGVGMHTGCCSQCQDTSQGKISNDIIRGKQDKQGLNCGEHEGRSDVTVSGGESLFENVDYLCMNGVNGNADRTEVVLLNGSCQTSDEDGVNVASHLSAQIRVKRSDGNVMSHKENVLPKEYSKVEMHVAVSSNSHDDYVILDDSCLGLESSIHSNTFQFSSPNEGANMTCDNSNFKMTNEKQRHSISRKNCVRYKITGAKITCKLCGHLLKDNSTIYHRKKSKQKNAKPPPIAETLAHCLFEIEKREHNLLQRENNLRNHENNNNQDSKKTQHEIFPNVSQDTNNEHAVNESEMLSSRPMDNDLNDEILLKRLGQLDSREAELTEMEARLVEKEVELVNREMGCSERETELVDYEETLEMHLQELEEELRVCKLELFQIQDYIEKDGDAIGQQEQERAMRQQSVSSSSKHQITMSFGGLEVIEEENQCSDDNFRMKRAERNLPDCVVAKNCVGDPLNGNDVELLNGVLHNNESSSEERDCVGQENDSNSYEYFSNESLDNCLIDSNDDYVFEEDFRSVVKSFQDIEDENDDRCSCHSSPRDVMVLEWDHDCLDNSAKEGKEAQSSGISPYYGNIEEDSHNCRYVCNKSDNFITSQNGKSSRLLKSEDSGLQSDCEDAGNINDDIDDDKEIVDDQEGGSQNAEDSNSSTSSQGKSNRRISSDNHFDPASHHVDLAELEPAELETYLQVEREELHAERACLQCERNEVTAATKALHREAQSMRRRSLELSQKERELEADKEYIIREIMEAESVRQQLDRDRALLQEQQEQLDAEISVFRQEKFDIMVELDVMVKREQQLDKKDCELSKLSDRIRSEREALAVESQQLEENGLRLQTKREMLRDAKLKLATDQNKVAVDIHRLEKDKKMLNSARTKLAEEIIRLEIDRQRLEAERKVLKEQQCRLMKDREKLEEDRTVMEENKQTVKDDVDHVNALMQSLETEKATLKQKMEKLRAEQELFWMENIKGENDEKCDVARDDCVEESVEERESCDRSCVDDN